MKLNISLPRPLMPLALLFALLFFAVNLSAAPLHLGSDISFHYYEDREGDLTFEQFRQLPLSDLTETDHIRSFGYTNSAFWVRFSLPETLFLGGDRWLKLGPNFLDRLTLYYREAGPHNIWTKHEAGDLSTTPRGEIDYRFPVFILPALKTSASRQEGGYEVIIRIESTSAVMLNASLWQPAEFSQHATSDSSFWSFYFGLAFISSALALILAVLLRHRLLWTIFLFSLTSVLVACVEGYIAWIWGDIGLRLQHYLTSTLTLLAYTSLLWMCTEAINIKKYLPRTNKFIMLMVIGNLLLQTSIPFDFYGLAIKVQGIILITSALIFTGAVFFFWKIEKPHPLYLILGFSPLVYMICAVLALLSLYGLIPFERTIYVAWQYIVLVNMALVLWVATSRILEENRQAREKALMARELRLEREANHHQRQFIGMVSHEFRTPLSIISATLQNLQLLPCDQPVAVRYNKIQRATNRLVQLTDNCLADARLEGTIVSLQTEAINLTNLLLEISSTIEQSEQHQLELSWHGHRLSTGESIPDITTIADRAMLRIALSNLVDNALKYSPSGIILIDISLSVKQITISITDQGPGVPADQADLIFKRYLRLPSAVGTNAMGTGLGLYIARQVARSHGGDLCLATSSPQGCCFELTLPH